MSSGGIQKGRRLPEVLEVLQVVRGVQDAGGIELRTPVEPMVDRGLLLLRVIFFALSQG